jgi:hypothetical protein
MYEELEVSDGRQHGKQRGAINNHVRGDNVM